MAALLLRLAGPMQAWGNAVSRYPRRETWSAPSKSGVMGLLAAAGGRRRTESIEDLAALRFGVRIDQPGQLVRDFQTATHWSDGISMLSQRFYLADAVFLAGVEGDVELLAGLREHVRRPVFPLYLGRRSCPPMQPLVAELVDDELERALLSAPWQAAEWYRRTQPSQVRLGMLLDADRPTNDTEPRHDVPISYDPADRKYGWRDVRIASTDPIANPIGRRGTDYFSEVIGG